MLTENDVKSLLIKMIKDRDIRLHVDYDNYEHELTFKIEICTSEEELFVEQEKIRL